MKTFIILSILLLAVSCGSGGGGSSSGGSNPGNTPANFMDRDDSNYELRINGCNGTAFTVVAFIDPGTVDEVRHDINGTVIAGNTIAYTLSGKAIEWEVTSISGGCSLDMVLTRNTNGAIFVATDNGILNGQTGFIQDY